MLEIGLKEVFVLSCPGLGTVQSEYIYSRIEFESYIQMWILACILSNEFHLPIVRHAEVTHTALYWEGMSMNRKDLRQRYNRSNRLSVLKARNTFGIPLTER